MDPPWLQKDSSAAASAILNEEHSFRAQGAEEALLSDAKASLAAARREVLLSGGVPVPKAHVETLVNAADGDSLQAPRGPFLFQLKAPMGLFCSNRAAACVRPCCGGHASAFSELGSGVTAYFKLEKLLATLFVLCTLASLPLLIINFNGGNDGVTSLNPVAATTLGNVAGVNGTSFLLLPLLGATRITASAILYGALDVVCVCLFLAAYVWARVFVKREHRAVDAATLTLQDYSLVLHNIAPRATKEDVREWVQRVVLHAASRGSLDALGAVRAVNEAQAAAPAPRLVALDSGGGGSGSGSSAADALREAFEVHSVAIVHDHSLLEGALARCGSAKERGAALRGASISAALRWHELERAPPALLRPLLEPPAPKALADARLKVWREEALADFALDALVAKRLLPAGQLEAAAPPLLEAAMPAVAAFVSFEHAAARALFLSALPTGALGRACAHAGLKLHGVVPRASEAEAPSSVSYSNLRFTPPARCARVSVSNVVAALVISACFAVIIQILGVKQALLRKVTPEDCSSRTLTSFVKFYTTQRSAEDERQFLSLFPFTNPLMYCVCDSRGYSSAPAAALGEGDKYLQKCFFQVCPRFSKLLDARAAAWPECKQISEWKTTATSFSAVAAVAISIVQEVLGKTVRALSAFEGHSSSAQQDASVGRRVFVLSVFNLLALPILVNMRLGLFPTGLYSDFTPGWYATVGADFISGMFTAAISPHIGNLVSLLGLEQRWRNQRLFLTNANRASLTALLSGPTMDFQVRSAHVMVVATVCFVLSSNLPLLYAAAAVAISGAFWADKLFLTRLYRAPPFSGTAVVEDMVAYMPFALLAHIGVALWCVSDMQLLDASAALPSADPLRSAATAPALATPTPTLAPRRALAAAALTASAAGGAGANAGRWRALAALAALLGGTPLVAPPTARVMHPLAARFDAPSGGWAAVGATVINPRGHRLALRVAAVLPGCGGGATSMPVPAGTAFLHSAVQGDGEALRVGVLELGGACNSGACCVVVDCVTSAPFTECPEGVSVVDDAALALHAPRLLQATPSPSPTATSSTTPTGSDTASTTTGASISNTPTLSGTPTSTASSTPTPTGTRSGAASVSSTPTPSLGSISSTPTVTVTPSSSETVSASPFLTATNTSTGTATGHGTIFPSSTPSQVPSQGPPALAGAGATTPMFGYSAGGCVCRSACQMDFVNGASEPKAVCLVGGGRRLQVGSLAFLPKTGPLHSNSSYASPHSARKLQASPLPTSSTSATVSAPASAVPSNSPFVSAAPSSFAAASLSAPPTATPNYIAGSASATVAAPASAVPSNSPFVSAAPSSSAAASLSAPPTATPNYIAGPPSHSAPPSATASLTATHFTRPTPSATQLTGCAAASLVAKSLGGPVDACALPSFGFSNRGCNCTSPCAVAPPLSSDRAVCGVDVLCPASFLFQGPAWPVWWDFCDAPAAQRAEPLSYCELHFFEPACQASNSSVPEDLKSLGKYLAVAGSNYTFTFLSGAFTKTVLGGGPGATSTGRSAALGAATSPGIAAVDLGRALLLSTIPITSGLGLAVSVLASFAAALLLKGAARGVARWCNAKRRVTLEEALRSSLPRAIEADADPYAVPLSRALRGEPARSAAGGELRLVGRTYAMRAQPHVYQQFNLTATLGAAHVELKPEHLALAESDGVFEHDARGLLFLTPLLWEPPDVFEDSVARLQREGGGALSLARSCPEGYKERLRRWVEQQPGGAGRLDKRERDPTEWGTWVYDKSWAGGPPAHATLRASASAAAPVKEHGDEGVVGELFAGAQLEARGGDARGVGGARGDAAATALYNMRAAGARVGFVQRPDGGADAIMVGALVPRGDFYVAGGSRRTERRGEAREREAPRENPRSFAPLAVTGNASWRGRSRAFFESRGSAPDLQPGELEGRYKHPPLTGGVPEMGRGGSWLSPDSRGRALAAGGDGGYERDGGRLSLGGRGPASIAYLDALPQSAPAPRGPFFGFPSGGVQRLSNRGPSTTYRPSPSLSALWRPLAPPPRTMLTPWSSAAAGMKRGKPALDERNLWAGGVVPTAPLSQPTPQLLAPASPLNTAYPPARHPEYAAQLHTAHLHGASGAGNGHFVRAVSEASAAASSAPAWGSTNPLFAGAAPGMRSVPVNALFVSPQTGTPPLLPSSAMPHGDVAAQLLLAHRVHLESSRSLADSIMWHLGKGRS